MDTSFCQKILPILKPSLLKTSYSRIVSEWVQTYYDTYKVAPEGAIQEIWQQKRTYITDDEVLESVGTFLESLSDTYDEDTYKNEQYWLDESEKYIRINSMENYVEKLSALLSTGKVDEAEALTANFTRVGIPNNEGVSLLDNLDRIEEAFSEEHNEILVRAEGDFGKVIGNLYRGDFSAGLASMKAGKSWYLIYLDECAMMAGCNVLHINFEMRENEIYRRAWKGLNWAPDVDGIVNMPYFHAEVEAGKEPDENTQYTIMHKMVQKQGISFSNKEQLAQMFKMRYHGGNIRYITLPSSTTTWDKIEALLDNLSYYSNYNVDFLSIDSIDLMGSKEREYRHKLNDLWENARRVAQQRRMHVASVSQTNKSGLKGEEIGAEDAAEDVRKNSHVSQLIGLYGTVENRQASYINAKCLITRYRPETWESAVILQQLDIGRWYVDSRLSGRMLK